MVRFRQQWPKAEGEEPERSCIYDINLQDASFEPGLVTAMHVQEHD